MDSWRHSLVECNMARCVWVLVDRDRREHMNVEIRMQDYGTMIDSLWHEDFVKMLVTLWVIWTARRKAIHEGIF
jgi:ATP sulfurylase